MKLGKFVQTVCLPEDNEGDLAMTKSHGNYKQQIVGEVQNIRMEFRNGLIQLQTVFKTMISLFKITDGDCCSNGTAVSFDSTVSFSVQGTREEEINSCYGHSEGVFVQKRKRGNGYRWVATGIVSCGHGCAHKDQFSLYTRVFPFMDWIKKNFIP